MNDKERNLIIALLCFIAAMLILFAGYYSHTTACPDVAVYVKCKEFKW